MKPHGGGQAASWTLLTEAQEDIDRKRHKRDPFAAKYVSLATSTFGEAPAQVDLQPDAGRTAVEAAATAVHVRVELIKTMKNALVKQTQEAAMRAAPPARPRLGARGGARHAAAAAAAATVGDDAAQLAEEGAASGTFFRDELHQRFQQLLEGVAPPAEELAALQEQLLSGQASDGNLLADSETVVQLEAELAPPPFEDFVQQLFGDEAADEAAAGSRPLDETEAAGLSAAVAALRLHTAQLEDQGVLLEADAEGDAWLLSGTARAWEPLPALPHYLQQGSLEHCLPERQQSQHSQQHQLAAGEWNAGAGASEDTMQNADQWAAFEEPGGHPDRSQQGRAWRPLVQLQLGQAALEQQAVCVQFDDEPEARSEPAAAPGGAACARSGAGPDPYGELEAAHPQQQLGGAARNGTPNAVPPVRDLRLLAIASRRQAALLIPPSDAGAATADEGGENCDAGMLDEAAALDRRALQQRQQLQPSPQRRRVPVFRGRVFAKREVPAGVWPPTGPAADDCIEEADSEGEQQRVAAAPSDGQQWQGAVPQRGRRAALPLAATRSGRSVPAAAGNPDVPEAQAVAAPAMPCPPSMPAPQRDCQVAGAAEEDDRELLHIDFSAIDVETLRPSVLLRPPAGKPKWRPVLNPESLLLPSLRVAAPLPAALGQAAAPAPPIGGVVADAASAALLMAGLTAEDLAEWDDWGEDWGPPAPAGGVASRAAHAPAPEQQLEVQWDEPELPDAAISFTTPSNTAAAPPVRAEPLGVEVQLCFDDNSDDGGGCHEEAEGGQLTANGPPQYQPGWQPARPEVEHSAWQQQLSLAGWDPGSHERQQRELEWGLDDDLWSQLDGTAASPTAACAHGSRVAPAADPWAALQPQGHDSSAGAGASRSAVTHARRRGRLRPTADSPASAMSLSSSAALSFAIDTDSGVAASAADGEETGVGGCWGCDMEWDECAAFDAAERQSVPAHCPSVLAAEGARQPATAVAAAQPGQFDWEFDDGEAVAAGAVVSMGPTKPALLEGTAPALARAQAGKRRHADIGAEIIQALLEERRRAHVDLQPLLQQLTQRMAAAFASGGGPVLLSSLRQECLDSGAAGTQGSTKRYLMALLTAANQHNAANAGCGAAEEQRASGAATAGLLAAALGGRHLRLSALPGGADVTVAAV